jgi:hypothetical protein
LLLFFKKEALAFALLSSPDCPGVLNYRPDALFPVDVLPPALLCFILRKRLFVCRTSVTRAGRSDHAGLQPAGMRVARRRQVE